jgi:hypothetical protein
VSNGRRGALRLSAEQLARTDEDDARAMERPAGRPRYCFRRSARRRKPIVQASSRNERCEEAQEVGQGRVGDEERPGWVDRACERVPTGRHGAAETSGPLTSETTTTSRRAAAAAARRARRARAGRWRGRAWRSVPRAGLLPGKGRRSPPSERRPKVGLASCYQKEERGGCRKERGRRRTSKGRAATTRPSARTRHALELVAGRGLDGRGVSRSGGGRPRGDPFAQQDDLTTPSGRSGVFAGRKPHQRLERRAARSWLEGDIR